MPKYFTEPENIKDGFIEIFSDEAKHILNVMRMEIGDTLTICDGQSNDYLCRICETGKNCLKAKIEETTKSESEPKTKITLYQGLPKSDKMELIIQKAVELGAYSVVPVAMKRSVVKLDDKKAKSKVARWNTIAESAAKQSKRSIMPKVSDVVSFKQAVAMASELDVLLLPYECAEGIEHTRQVIASIGKGKSIGIFIGPEGGFDKDELELATNAGADIITLGRRILRTETAGLMLMSVLMYNMEE